MSSVIRSVGSALGDELECLFSAFSPWFYALKLPSALTGAVELLLVAAVNVTVPGPKEASPVFDAFVSYSLEFAFFPDFAGTSAPYKIPSQSKMSLIMIF